MKTIITAAVILVFMSILTQCSCTDLHLTPEEHAWLKNHKSIRIAGPAAFPPFQYSDENGIPMGIAVDYVRFISRQTGMNMDIQKKMKWSTVFSCDYEDAPDRIRTLVRNHDPEGAFRVVHALKGVAGNLAVTEVYQIAAELNTQVKEKPPEELAPLVRSLEQAMNTTITAIRRLEPEPSAALPAPLFENRGELGGELEDVFRDMLASFEQYNPQAVSPYLEKLGRFLAPCQLEPIQHQLEQFDFEGARDETLRLACSLGIDKEELS